PRRRRAQGREEVLVNKHRLQDSGDRSVCLLEYRRHALHERGWRIVCDKIRGQLPANEASRRWLTTEQRDCPLDLVEALVFEDLTQHRLRVHVMARGVELEQPVPHI